jgi:hypothetical protein
LTWMHRMHRAGHRGGDAVLPFVLSEGERKRDRVEAGTSKSPPLLGDGSAGPWRQARTGPCPARERWRWRESAAAKVSGGRCAGGSRERRSCSMRALPPSGKPRAAAAEGGGAKGPEGERSHGFARVRSRAANVRGE